MINNPLSERRITVNASKKYDMIIGTKILDDVGNLINKILCSKKIALITDDAVDKLYSAKVVKSLSDSGFSVVKFVFKNGEESKNIKTYGEILEFLAENELTRSDAIVALGGGVVGDLAGFCAATYLRGIKYVQIPTTLLAGVDSSVGGKTAIDLSSGKNLAGAFYQPEAVICDVDVFNTLPQDVLDGGMGEIAKYAVLDGAVYSLIKQGGYSYTDLVYACVDYKRRIVEEDEFEGGKRKLLNLGHTPAHAIERLSGYKVPHGVAVAAGVRFILEKSLKHGYLEENAYKDLVSVCNKCVKADGIPYTAAQLCRACLTDKKRKGDYISLMMVFGLEDVREIKVGVNELEEYFL